MALTAALCFVTKGVHAALRAQVRVGTWLEVIIVATWRAWCIKVTGWTGSIVTWAAVVELTGRACALALWAVAVTGRTITIAWRAVTQLRTFTIACGAVAHTVTAHMAIGAWCTTTFATLTATATCIAATASGFGVANALHHFAACGFGRCSHHVTAWGLAQTTP